MKYDFLYQNSIQTVDYKELTNLTCDYFFVPKNFENVNYFNGFSVNKLFEVYNTGIETGRDSFFIDFDNNSLKDKILSAYNNIENKTIIDRYKIKNDSNFRFLDNMKKLKFDETLIKKITYRPFDNRFTYYDIELQRRPSYKTIKNILNCNIALVTSRQQSTFNFQHIIVTNCITERCTISLQTKETSYVFPLYLYPDSSTQQSLEHSPRRTPNLNMTIVQEIAQKLNLIFTQEKETTTDTFAPIDILDYIYAVLHSPSYRANYKEFLKIDFPRVPYPDAPEMFWKLGSFGGELRRLHLLESVTMDSIITTYPEDGENTVTRKISAKDWDLNDPANSLGRVWINDTQYFDKVPLVAWEFYIGGYQPAQKWLKDRYGRTLSIEDLIHYQKIIVALTETDRIMKVIDVEIAIVDKTTTCVSRGEEIS